MDTTILFVEDNEELRENAALVLGLEGYAVKLARDGREALDLLDDGFVPDLIVSDIMMPRMNGYEFFEAVRQKDHLKGVPFIFLTARGSRRDISVGRMLGADDYLVKPFDPEDFLLAVQNKLQRAAEMRAQAAQSLDQARRSLVQMLSHELRTPLTYVTGGFALLAEELETQQAPSTSEDVRVSLDLIQNGTQRLNRLAEQMVLYSEIISGYIQSQVAVASEEVDLEMLVSDALGILLAPASERKISFHRTCQSDFPVATYGVRELLVTATSEVIRNAIQHSPEGSSIELVVARESEFGTITVIDHGTGIRPEDQASIWELLSQADRSRNEQQGVGMGLPIVKGIVTAHNGDVFLYSVPGVGTEMTLRLPLYPPGT